MPTPNPIIVRHIRMDATGIATTAELSRATAQADARTQSAVDAEHALRAQLAEVTTRGKQKSHASDADSTRGTPRIVRLARPKLDGGPHLSYAFQWCGFATIALIGAAVVTARSMQKTST